MAVAESVYDGTWGGQEQIPDEIVDFELMLGMRWSWQALIETPPYVRQFCWDLLQVRLANIKRPGRG